MSNDNGSFEFTGLPVKAYLLQVASVGYHNKTIVLPVFPTSGKPLIDAGNISLAAAPAGLNEVVVTAVRQIIKQEVD
ncbi:hypothetical protein [Parasediminibacterium sp. JCM 36343]|uniref:hypothetical protein n=1 Tax=Parasediminibacterium sp. JCM 36343 TaxID=3374279 RepID=UPI00397CAA76